jgi:adenosylhomocysteinase
MFDVNDAKMKHFFDNRYGTGQSVLDGFMHATNLLIAGKSVVVGGYGFCGKGIAMRMKGLGGIVTVTEVDPVKAIEAVMDGFYVDKMENALRTADIVVTATGVKNIITTKQLMKAKSGVVLSNAGHFNNEISFDDLEKNCERKEKVRGDVVRYYLKSGNYVDLVSDGRLVNLASGQGHPVEIMDMSFAIQALVAEYLVKNHASLKPGLYSVPEEIDNQVAEIKLHSLGISIDRYTEEQLKYINSWDEGT